jgi:hypothetical protein
MVRTLAGTNLPAGGAIEALARLGHQVVPLAWAAATPSAKSVQVAFAGAKVLVSCWNPPTAIRAMYCPCPLLAAE